MTVKIHPLDTLLSQVRACTLCAAPLRALQLTPRPVVQAHQDARLLIVGQAPGRKVHASGIPWDDASGERLRAWLGVSRDTFYDARQIALLPMGFCYPGTGASGDLPPRPECAPAWRSALLAELQHIRLTLVIGQYALAWHLPGQFKNVTDAVQAGLQASLGPAAAALPDVIALPHPSPRNNRWLASNAWFEGQVLPALRRRVIEVLPA